MMIKYVVMVAIALVLVAFLAWAFLPARYLPGRHPLRAPPASPATASGQGLRSPAQLAPGLGPHGCPAPLGAGPSWPAAAVPDRLPA
jgi:hypothetical protein